ncbi:MAG: transketolase [Chromatiales bacterium]|nr:transketolase [Chromatiales bacterium]
MTSNPGGNRSPARRRALANAVRALAMDAVEQANSGHPGMPMGMADIAEVLWNDFLRHNPADPHWPDRDRFVLSNGHGSMLLYAVAHLTGYPLGIDELRNFRQLGSRTAGHPEREVEIGVETTTGPLGQGLANAVGMALAEALLAARFNRPGFPVVDHRTFVFLGDGCLMEGVSHEACSLAGTLGLGKLVCLYDDNGISIDGEVDAWFADDTPARFRAYGWHVVADVDGHDPVAVQEAIKEALARNDRPSLICCRTVIGYGAPNLQGSEKTHGAPLGGSEIAAARAALGWPHAPFEIPEDIRADWDARARGQAAQADWERLFADYAGQYPELAAEFRRRQSGALPADWTEAVTRILEGFAADTSARATRKSSQDALNAFAPLLPELVGGSADLTGSNLTRHRSSVDVAAGSFEGNYIYYGVREFGMAAAMNGMALHGGVLPYGGTFLTFSDYARNALRLAALMEAPVIHVFTHDSIGLGEDGPTHQPVEHLASLRIMPNMRVWRPCDGLETAWAWRDALERRDGPTSLALSRQSLPAQPRSPEQVTAVARGGYVLVDAADPELILMASGSEVQLAVEAAALLAAEGRRVRVVSMPSLCLFSKQDASWQEAVLPASVGLRIAIEAGVPDSWYRWVGPSGRVLGMSGYGLSAPASDLFRHFGFTAERVAGLGRELLAAN